MLKDDKPQKSMGFKPKLMLGGPTEEITRKALRKENPKLFKEEKKDG